MRSSTERVWSFCAVVHSTTSEESFSSGSSQRYSSTISTPWSVSVTGAVLVAGGGPSVGMAREDMVVGATARIVARSAWCVVIGGSVEERW